MDKDKGLLCSAWNQVYREKCRHKAFVLLPKNLCKKHFEEFLKKESIITQKEIDQAFEDSEGGVNMGRRRPKGSTNKASPMAAKKPVKKEEPTEEY